MDMKGGERGTFEVLKFWISGASGFRIAPDTRGSLGAGSATFEIVWIWDSDAPCEWMYG